VPSFGINGNSKGFLRWQSFLLSFASIFAQRWRWWRWWRRTRTGSRRTTWWIWGWVSFLLFAISMFSMLLTFFWFFDTFFTCNHWLFWLFFHRFWLRVQAELINFYSNSKVVLEELYWRFFSIIAANWALNLPILLFIPINFSTFTYLFDSIRSSIL